MKKLKILPLLLTVCLLLTVLAPCGNADILDYTTKPESTAELGCTGTHFTNTNGMPDEGHYTTALDLYRITLEALKHEKFTEICDTASYITAATNMSGERELHNSNALINGSSVYGSDYVYEGAYGVKTGRTDAAGHCLVAAAKRGDLNLLCVVLGADGDYEEKEFKSFSDAVGLFDWALGNFSRRSLLDAGEVVGEMPVNLGDGVDKVNMVTANDIEAMAPMGITAEHIVTELYLDYESIDAPVKAGTVLGKLELYDDSGDYYGETEVLAAADVQMDVGEYLKGYAMSLLEQNWMYIAAAVAGIIALVFAIIVLRHKNRRKRTQARHAKGKR